MERKKCYFADPDRVKALGMVLLMASRALLDLSVVASWNETASEIDVIDKVTNDATVIGDADDSLNGEVIGDDCDHQLRYFPNGRISEIE